MDIVTWSQLKKKANLVNGKVPASELPSFVDDVVEVQDYAHLPQPGEQGKIYVTLNDNCSYRWSGTTYIKISDPNIKTINGESLIGIGNIEIKTYQAFPSTFRVNQTVQDFVNSVFSTPGVTAGMAYLGGLYCSDLPVTPAGQFSNVEACVTIITSSILVIEITTGSNGYTPYMWKYNSFLGRWESWSKVIANPSGSSSTQLNKVSIDGVNYNIIPALPSDAGTKTYTLQAVNGTITWVDN